MDSKDFNPILLERGQLRVALNLTVLGEKAWDALTLASRLGLPQPQFRAFMSDKGSEVWAVLIDETHSYDADRDTIMEPWESAVDALTEALEPASYLKIMVAHRLKQNAIAA
jgi:hypothetical protein